MKRHKYKMGDKIKYRGGFGDGPVEEVTIESRGSKNGKPVYDLSNGHWCYEYQILDLA